MMNNTRTVILQRGEERLQLAVNPRQMVISQPQNTLSYVTVRGETVHAARGSGLTQVTLRTLYYRVVVFKDPLQGLYATL